MEDKLDVGQGLRQILEEILTVRARLGRMAEEHGPDGPLAGKIEAACAKLERIAAGMHWAAELGTEDPDRDPRVLRRIQVAQRHLIDKVITHLGVLIAELRAGEESELVN